jgi:hypothetical protein
MADRAEPDLVVWGSVIPNLGWSNIAREVWLDAKLGPNVPATTNVAISTALRRQHGPGAFLAKVTTAHFGNLESGRNNDHCGLEIRQVPGTPFPEIRQLEKAYGTLS